jgi:hypothetical protein
VYFTIYEGSIEEHRYEESIKRERRAFDTLISHKAALVVMKDVKRSGGEDDAPSSALIGPGGAAVMNPYVRPEMDSRAAAGSSQPSSRGVVVDVRSVSLRLHSKQNDCCVNVYVFVVFALCVSCCLCSTADYIISSAVS